MHCLLPLLTFPFYLVPQSPSFVFKRPTPLVEMKLIKTRQILNTQPPFCFIHTSNHLLNLKCDFWLKDIHLSNFSEFVQFQLDHHRQIKDRPERKIVHDMHVSVDTIIFINVGKQLERRKQEDELKRVMQQEQHFERVKVRAFNCIFCFTGVC